MGNASGDVVSGLLVGEQPVHILGGEAVITTWPGEVPHAAVLRPPGDGGRVDTEQDGDLGRSQQYTPRVPRYHSPIVVTGSFTEGWVVFDVDNNPLVQIRYAPNFGEDIMCHWTVKV